jgi:hypothetical protein
MKRRLESEIRKIVADFLAHPVQETPDLHRDRHAFCSHDHWSHTKRICLDCGITERELAGKGNELN